MSTCDGVGILNESVSRHLKSNDHSMGGIIRCIGFDMVWEVSRMMLQSNKLYF